MLESVNRVIIKVAESGLDIMRNPFGDSRLMHDYKIYERYVRACEFLMRNSFMIRFMKVNKIKF